MGGRSGAAGAGWNEKIADGREDTDEPLQVPGRPKALHHPLSSPEWQMRILGPVIQPLMRAMLNRRHDLTLGGSIGAQLVRDHPPRGTTLLLQQTLQQALGRFGVTAGLDDLIEDIAVLIHCPPQPVLLAGNRDHDFVEMPNVVPARSLAFEAAGVIRSKLQSPSPNSLI
jgi:hypothetical protein